MGNLGLCVKYAKERSQEREREFLALGYRESMDELIAGLSEDERGEFEERAGILEHDGGLLRDEAEKAALTEMLAAINNSDNSNDGKS